MSIWILVAVVLCFFWWMGAMNTATKSRCPSCLKLSAMIYQDRRETARRQGYATVTRTDFYNSNSGSGTIEREEQALVVRVTYSNRLRCKYCGHELYTTTTQQYEPDFAEIQQSRRAYDEVDDGNDWHNDSF